MFCVKNDLLSFCVFSSWSRKHAAVCFFICCMPLLPCQLALTSSQNLQLLCQHKRPDSEGAQLVERTVFGAAEDVWIFYFYSQFQRPGFLKEEHKEAVSPSTHESVHGPKRDNDKNTQFPFAKLTLPI